jgi:hypothetical protein
VCVDVFCVDRRTNDCFPTQHQLTAMYEEQAVFTSRYKLNLIVILIFKTGRAMAQTVGRRPLTAEFRVLSHVSPSETCSEQSGTGACSSPSTSVSPSQYLSTDAPLSSSTRRSDTKGKRRSLRTSPNAMLFRTSGSKGLNVIQRQMRYLQLKRTSEMLKE